MSSRGSSPSGSSKSIAGGGGSGVDGEMIAKGTDAKDNSGKALATSMKSPSSSLNHSGMEFGGEEKEQERKISCEEI